MSTAWTDELRQEIIEEYQKEEPTPETTMDIVADIASNHSLTVNGVRMVLSRAEVYITKGKTESASKEDKPKKKPKQESLDDLTALLTKHGVEPDDAVISKLTGKAAEYFIGAFTTIIES